MGSIPGPGTKILQAARPNEKKIEKITEGRPKNINGNTDKKKSDDNAKMIEMKSYRSKPESDLSALKKKKSDFETKVEKIRFP